MTEKRNYRKSISTRSEDLYKKMRGLPEEIILNVEDLDKDIEIKQLITFMYEICYIDHNKIDDVKLKELFDSVKHQLRLYIKYKDNITKENLMDYISYHLIGRTWPTFCLDEELKINFYDLIKDYIRVDNKIATV